MDLVKLGQMENNDGSHEIANRVYSTVGVSPTVCANCLDAIPKILDTVKIKTANAKGYEECNIGGVVDFLYPNSTTRRGRVQENGEICPAITAEANGLCKVESKYRIRKLTPRECWRLMGFTDEDFEKAQAVNSNTQLYKQAGNSIVKNVLMAIFRQLNINQVKE